MKIIQKSALAVVQSNKLLVVRPNNSQFLLMPGGKPEADESSESALKREIMEELNCAIDEKSIKFLGVFEDVAAGSNGSMVRIDLYSGSLIGTPKPSSEIEELFWISSKDISLPQLSPIIKNKIIPFLVGKKLL